MNQLDYVSPSTLYVPMPITVSNEIIVLCGYATAEAASQAGVLSLPRSRVAYERQKHQTSKKEATG